MPLVYHKPVLVDEVLHYMNPAPGKQYLDVTFGTGGHTRTLLTAQPKCHVIAMDWDTTVLEVYGKPLQEEFGDRLQLLWGNFSNLHAITKKAHIDKVDGILADFGTSQVQIMNRPGFSLYRDTHLDMRMSPAHQKITAEYVVNKSSEQKLADIFHYYGEERYARKIARAIIERRKKKPIKTTRDLALLVEHVVGTKRTSGIHPATRIFQALRIYVNKELENIQSFLTAALHHLNPKARLVCISFHSLEDRIVKQFFQKHAAEGSIKIITKKVVTASPEEIRQNPSARSARLRVAEFV